MSESSKKDKRKEIDLLHLGKAHKIGFDIFTFKKENDKEYKPYMFCMPNFTALFLNISDKNYEISQNLYNEKICKLPIDKGELYELNEQDEHFIYDFMESTFASIVFACASVETLINNIIPNNIVLIKPKKGISYELNFKDFIEKHLTIEEKLKKILPSVYDYGFNAKELKCWQGFKKLIEYRNEIMHFKSHSFDKQNFNKQTKYVHDLFYHVISDEIIESARLLIKYLSKKIKGVPGFPSEFIEDELHLGTYINHYKNFEILKRKLIIEFPDKRSLEEFISNKLFKNRYFKFYTA